MRHASSLADPTHSKAPRQPLVSPRTSLEIPRATVQGLSVATLFADERSASVARAVQALMSRVGAPIDIRHLPAALAHGGTVGRIGVPTAATALMLDQRVMLGSTFGASPLAPVSRLWRGLQRRADVLVDMRQCATLPGSAAALAGAERDVLLVAHRVFERTPRPDAHPGEQWTRSRDAAELVYRLAAAENRVVLLVLPIGRGSQMQQSFSDALERHARLHRLPTPRTVKAGLLAALLSGEAGSGRWLAASVMRIDALCALTNEAIGDTGPWPVVSMGRDVTFYDTPAASRSADSACAMLLVMASLLKRNGRPALARTLLHALHLTVAAAARMREELGTELQVPTDAFVRGVLANWGRAESAEQARTGRPGDRGHRRMLDPTLSRDGVELLPETGQPTDHLDTVLLHHFGLEHRGRGEQPVPVLSEHLHQRAVGEFAGDRRHHVLFLEPAVKRAANR